MIYPINICDINCAKCLLTFLNISQYVFTTKDDLFSPSQTAEFWCPPSFLSIRLQLLAGSQPSWCSYWFSDRNSGELGVGVTPSQSATVHHPLLSSPQTVSGGKTSPSPPVLLLSDHRSQWRRMRRRCFVLLLLWHPQHWELPSNWPSYSGHILSHGSNFLPVRQQSGELK